MIQRFLRVVPLITALALVVAALFASGPVMARELSPGAGALPQQDGGEPETYENELLGLNLTLPAGWQALPGGQDYDLALVSPEALVGETGALMTLLSVAGLGADATLESALEPIAAQVEGTVEPLTNATNEGMQVQFSDEASGLTQRQVLFPYGDMGEVFYIQTLAPTDQEDVIDSILDSLELAPPQPDVDALDAAWQASVAESGRMIYGDADAPITLVEFYSFTCPHCANYSFPLNRLIALDVESGLVQIELVSIAGDALADYATHATYCAAEQGAGYSAYKALFAGSINLGREYAFSPDGIVEILSGLDADLDMAALDTCIQDARYADQMNEARTRFTDYGLTGTPTVLLGTPDVDVQPLVMPDGRVWSGSIPVEMLRTIFTMITEEGVALDEVVNELMAESEAQ